MAGEKNPSPPWQKGAAAARSRLGSLPKKESTELKLWREISRQDKISPEIPLSSSQIWKSPKPQKLQSPEGDREIEMADMGSLEKMGRELKCPIWYATTLSLFLVSSILSWSIRGSANFYFLDLFLLSHFLDLLVRFLSISMPPMGKLIFFCVCGNYDLLCINWKFWSWQLEPARFGGIHHLQSHLLQVSPSSLAPPLQFTCKFTTAWMVLSILGLYATFPLIAAIAWWSRWNLARAAPCARFRSAEEVSMVWLLRWVCLITRIATQIHKLNCLALLIYWKSQKITYECLGGSTGPFYLW